MRLWAAWAAAVGVAITLTVGGCGGKTGSGIMPEQALPPSAVPQGSAPAITQLPPPSALRGASYTQKDLYHWGNEYGATLPHNRVTPSGIEAVFLPHWVKPGAQFSDLAYATYQFQLDGFDLEPTLHFNWTRTAGFADGWTALADFQRDRWEWQQLPENGVMTFDPAKNISATGAMYVVVLTTGEAQWRLREVSICQGASGPWPMFGHDAKHTRRSPYVGSQTGKLKWTFRTTGAMMWFTDALVGPDGTIYVGSGSDLHAVNPDGSVKWYFVNCHPASKPVRAPDGTLYVGSYDFKI